MRVQQELGLGFEPVIAGRFNGKRLEIQTPYVMTRLFGYTREDWNDFTFPFRAIPARDRRPLVAAIERMRANPGVTDNIIFGFYPKGSTTPRTIEFQGQLSPGRSWIYFVARDITDQERKEQERIRNARMDGIQLAARTIAYASSDHLEAANNYLKGLAQSPEVPNAQKILVTEVKGAIDGVQNTVIDLWSVREPIVEVTVELNDGAKTTIIDLKRSRTTNGSS